MSLFPTDVDLETVSTSTDSTVSTTSSTSDDVGRSFTFDYDENKFVFNQGKVSETTQLEAIKQWIELYIRTAVFKFKIYDEQFGVNTNGLVGYRLPRGYQIAEIIRRINEGILNQCPNVVSVTDWAFDSGHFSFKVTTDFGEVNISE